MLFKNTSKRIMSICASGRGFTVVLCMNTKFYTQIWKTFRPKFIQRLFISNPWFLQKDPKSVSCPFTRSSLDLSYCMGLDHTYFVLISVHGLKINHRFEINHLCEIGPVSLNGQAICDVHCVL